MAITVIYSDKEKATWTYDYKQNKWRGYLLDTYKSVGADKPLRRVRIRFARRIDAEDAELAIELEKKNDALGIVREKDKRQITVKELLDKHQKAFAGQGRREMAERVS